MIRLHYWIEYVKSSTLLLVIVVIYVVGSIDHSIYDSHSKAQKPEC